MNPEIGARLGPYEIVSPIGRGGMGEVFRARDTRVDRSVAIKFSQAQFSERFDREARAIAALNHPNICQLYDVGPDYLVMEYVEGANLQCPLPLDEALPIAMKIAEALEAAHERGIIHRDLKPANVKIGDDGAVKVLDFGLAKISDSPESAASADLSPTMSPTLSVAATRAGTILGTAAYMAPEQVRGRRVDKRADIWAFGCVLFEMLSGKRAFAGDEASDILASVLKTEPNWSALPAGTPPRIVELLRHCLTKDPRERVRDIGDARIAIREALREPRAPATSADRMLPRWSFATAAAIVGIVVGGGSIELWRSRGTVQNRPSGPITHTVIDLPKDAPLALGAQIPLEGFDSPAVALSPDGRYLAYVGQSASGNVIYLRETGGLTIRPVAGTEGAIYAFFSPDARWLGFLTNDKVKKVSLDGGAPITLSDARAPVSATWLRDDTIYFGSSEGWEISRTSAAGGGATLIGPQQYTAGKEGTAQPPPLWGTLSQVLPDGRAALLAGPIGVGGDYADVILVSLPTLATKILLHGGYNARFVAPNHVIFGRGGSLFAVRFDPVRGEIQGDPFPVASNVSMESFFYQVHFVVSDNGLLAYIPGGDRAIGRLAWVDRQGGTDFLPPPARLYGVVDLSPIGDRLAVTVFDVTNYIWIYDLKRNEGRRLTADFPSDGAIWSPDGTTLTFSRWEAAERRLKLLIQPADGGDIRELKTPADGFYRASRWSPDNKVLALDRGRFLRDDKVETMPNVPDASWVSAFSPDGRWIAYTAATSGRNEVFVQSFPDGKTVRQISVDGGIEVRWCRCGELFWRNGNRWMSSAIRTAPQLAWDPPKLAFQTDFVDTPGISYDVSPDGKRLLVVKRPEPDDRSHIHLITNWNR